MRDFIDQLSAAGPGHRAQIVNKSLYQRPQIKIPAFEFNAAFGAQTGVFFDDLLDQNPKVLHVSAERFQHPRCFGASASIAERELEHASRQTYGIQRGAKIVSDKGKIFFATLLNFERLLSGVGLEGHSNCLIEN